MTDKNNMPVSVDIVLPCFNPNSRWHLELMDFNQFIGDQFSVHYIIVNDGSVTGEINTQIEELQKNNISLDYISYPTNMGKGFALRRGVMVAMNPYIMYTDIDFPFTNQSVLALLESLVNTDSDVVVGFRNQQYYANKMTAFRRVLSRTFRFFIKRVIKVSITDTQCGLKGFNRKGRQKFLSTKTNRYLFDFEFIYSTCKDPLLKINPVEAQLKPDVQFSRMRPGILFQEMINLFQILILRRS